MDFLGQIVSDYGWALGLGLIVLAIILHEPLYHWIERRKFYRRGDSGLEEFESYRDMRRKKRLEGWVGCLNNLIGAVLLILGFILLLAWVIMMIFD